MRYQKPELLELGNAAQLIQSAKGPGSDNVTSPTLRTMDLAD